MQFLIGVVLFAISCLAFWHALPKDGQVRGYLPNDAVQAYYAVLLIGGLVGGSLLIILGAVSFFV